MERKKDKALWLSEAKLSYSFKIEYGVNSSQPAGTQSAIANNVPVFICRSRPGLNM